LDCHPKGTGRLNVLASSLFFNNRRIILDQVATLRLPAKYQWPEMADQGGLIGYGPGIVQLYRDVQSRQLVKRCGGTKPVDIPVVRELQTSPHCNRASVARRAARVRHDSSDDPTRLRCGSVNLV
jgi:hypothetical protein